MLDNRLPDGVVASQRQLRCAVCYFLAELSLFADAAAIAGRSHSVFCYHQSIPFLPRFYERRPIWRSAGRQGFAVVSRPSKTQQECRGGVHAG